MLSLPHYARAQCSQTTVCILRRGFDVFAEERKDAFVVYLTSSDPFAGILMS